VAHSLNRRQFLGQAAIISQSSNGGVFGYPANETIQIGVIGAGGRGRALMRALGGIAGVRIVAVADVWDQSLAAARTLADPRAFTTKDYQELLGRKDVDAVVIATPDHWHVPMTVDACAAGKDVYVEKPLTHTLSEGPTVIEAQNRYNRVVQVGIQQRSMPHIIKAREIVRSGRLGKIHKVHMTWNRNTPRQTARKLNIDPRTVDWRRFLGNAPKQPFDAYRFRHWRWFWDFGGGIFTDLMVHWVDPVRWFLDLDLPSSAASIGDHFQTEGLWQTPDTVQTLLHYQCNHRLQAYFEGTFSNARNAAMTELMGTEGTLYIDRGRYEVIPEPKRDAQGKPIKNPLPASQWVLGKGPRGADFYANPDGERLHLSNWLECVRTRSRPAVPVEEGVKSAAAAHWANMALRSGRVVSARLVDMAVRGGEMVTSKEANAG